jgi:hypothetical protein
VRIPSQSRNHCLLIHFEASLEGAWVCCPPSGFGPARSLSVSHAHKASDCMTHRWDLHSFCLFVGRRLAARRDSDSFSTCKAHEQTIGQHSHGRIRGDGRLSLACLCRGRLLRHQGCSAGPGREAGQEHEPASNRHTAGLLGLRRRPHHRSSRRNVTVGHHCLACPRVPPDIIHGWPASTGTKRFDRARLVRSVERWTSARACQVVLKVEASIGEKASFRPEAPVLSPSFCHSLRPVRCFWATPKSQDAQCRALRAPCFILLHPAAL